MRTIRISAVLAVLAALIAVSGSFLPAGAGSREATETIMQAGYDVGSGGTLRVDVPDADIEVHPGSGARVEVRVLMGAHDMEWGRKRVEAMNLRIDGDGSEVTVMGKNPRQRFSYSRGTWFALVVRVEIPVHFNVDLNSDDGDIVVDRLDGLLKVRTSDGDIRLGRIDTRDASVLTSDGDIESEELTGGELVIKSSDGDIVVGRIDGTRVSIRTSDGDISIREGSGALEASTSDGDIELGAGRLGATTLTSGDGDITILVDTGFGADVELEGENVVLSGAFEGQSKETRAAGRYNGGGPSLRATTRDGTVEIKSR